MTDDYKWENPNSPLVEYGGIFAGCCILWFCILFYPALVISIQFQRSFYTSADDALFPGLFVFLVVLGLIWILLHIPVPMCRIILISLYLFCLGPFVQWVVHTSDAEYLESWEYEQRLEELGIEWDPCCDWPEQEPFPGFRWFWFIPKWSSLDFELSDCPKIIFHLVKIIFSTFVIILIIRWILKACGKL